MKLTNTSTRTLALDEGIPFFSRLQLMSGGVELEDIQEWSRLYAILNSIQGSDLNINEKTLTQHDPTTRGQSDVGAMSADAAGGALVDAGLNARNNDLHAPAGQLVAGASVYFNFPLMSGIFNIDKYFPLLLTDQGLDLYFYLNTSEDIGVWSAAPDNGGFRIEEVKYVAHEVNLDESFINQMKQSMSATGGLLSMSSTTYRYYQSNLALGQTGSQSIPIACRVKSLKALIVRPQLQSLTNNRETFAVSTGQACGINQVQFRVGSVLYPQSVINFTKENPGELLHEVRKAFGTLGSYTHGTLLNRDNYQLKTSSTDADIDGAPGPGEQKSRFVIAYDFETFAKSATESGLNVGDRALPISMEINRVNHTGAAAAPTAEATRLDIFAMCDCIIYIDLMGRITTRI
jgi:hypothetical protein